LGNLATPKSVQKLQTALHAKAKTEAGYRYDKIYREDILAHAYAQCRSNKGAPGEDGQDFADRFRDSDRTAVGHSKQIRH
jgi:RNA-directed DNA polymerase